MKYAAKHVSFLRRKSSQLVTLTSILLAAAFGLAARRPQPDALLRNFSPNRAAAPCDEGNGGITLPAGFCATIFADRLVGARHMSVAPNGDVYVALQTRGSQAPEGGVVVLRDADNDGHAEKEERFGPVGGTGIVVQGGFVYLDAKANILRYPIKPGVMLPTGEPDTIVTGLPTTGNHTAHNIALDNKGNLFVNNGSFSNSCQEKDRIAGSKGVDPCVELETRAGIWKFSASRKGQIFSAAERFAAGIRNAVGLAWNSEENALYSTQHGRDNFVQNWPALYDKVKSAENPAEEFMKVSSGDDFGWPYCYYDIDLKKLVMAPEYGGDAKSTGRCSGKKSPLVAFPGHWAPNGLTFYTGSMFPARYRSGAFIAFHGSWNRAPMPQAGYRVVFVPKVKGKFDGTYETFANDFAGANIENATHRPTGVAVMPDGSLLISDDKAGRIWKVIYSGPK